MISSTSFVLRGNRLVRHRLRQEGGNGSGNGSGNAKRTDHKDHGDRGKDVDVKKDASPVREDRRGQGREDCGEGRREGHGEGRREGSEVRFGGLVPPSPVSVYSPVSEETGFLF